jgi:hypothetical protein
MRRPVRLFYHDRRLLRHTSVEIRQTARQLRYQPRRPNGKAQPPLRATQNGQNAPISCAQRLAAAGVGRRISCARVRLPAHDVVVDILLRDDERPSFASWHPALVDRLDVPRPRAIVLGGVQFREIEGGRANLGLKPVGNRSQIFPFVGHQFMCIQHLA